MEWDLVCSRAPLKKLTQKVALFGHAGGAFLTGLFSDRFGQVTTILTLVCIVTIFGSLGAISPTYPLFLCSVRISNFSSIGLGTAIFCWSMEILPVREKTIVGCTHLLNYTIGGLLVALVSYVFPHWSHMLLVMNLPFILRLLLWFFIPESPRWLLNDRQAEKATEIVVKIARANGKALPNHFALASPRETVKKNNLRFFDPFKTLNLRKNTLLLYYVWFTNFFVYYSLTLNSNNFGASEFTYFSIGKGIATIIFTSFDARIVFGTVSAIQIPFAILVLVLTMKTRRRIPTTILLLVCGLGLILTIAIPR